MKDYPIMFNGARIGSLTVEKKGLLTVFDAVSSDTGEIMRLSVYGDGREGYLGVMCPEKGKLRLVKRLSRADMSAFPLQIEYAAPSGAIDIYESQQLPETESRGNDEDTLWYSAPDGSLSTFNGDRLLVALPTDGGLSIPKGASGELRLINGREYIVFPR